MKNKKNEKQKTEKPDKGFRIFAATDIHGDVNLIKRLAEEAYKQKADVVVLCGDLTWADTEVPVLISPFTDKGLDVFLIPGNHETPATVSFLERLYSPKVRNIHDYPIVIKAKNGKKIGFFGCGSANIGLFELNESEIEYILKKGYEKISDSDFKIMVTHVPPFNTKVDDLGFPTGSIGVRETIEKFNPDFCLCGHIHETFGKQDKIGKTKIINVGRKGTLIEL